MGYKIQFENGHVVEFDSKPSDADIEDAHKHVMSLPDPNEDGFWKKAAGVGEAALSTVSGLAAAIPTGIRTLAELPSAGDLGTAVERAKSTSEAATYEPRTKTGKALSKSIQDTMSNYSQEVANKFSGDSAYLAGEKLRKGQDARPELAAENTEHLFGDIIGNIYAPGIGSFTPKRGVVKPKQADIAGGMNDLIQPDKPVTPPATPNPTMAVTPEGQGIAGPRDAAFKAEAERKAALVAGARPVPGRDLADPFGQMKQQLGAEQGIPAQPSAAMDQMAQRLQGEQPSPLRSQMEMFGEQKPDLQLSQEPMDLPKIEPKMLDGEQGQMFGNPELFDLQGGEGAKAPPKPATGEGMTQGELDVNQTQMDLQSGGEMAKPLDPNAPVQGPQGDLIGPDLTLSDETKIHDLPADSLFKQLSNAVRDKITEDDPRVKAAQDRVTAAEQAVTKAAGDLAAGRITRQSVDHLAKDLQSQKDALEFLKQSAVDEQRMKDKLAAQPQSSPGLKQSGGVDIGPLKEAVDKAMDVLRKLPDIPLIRSVLEKYEATQSPKVFADARRSAKADGASPELLKALDDAYLSTTQKVLGDMDNLLDKQANRIPPGPKPRSPGNKQTGAIFLDSKKLEVMKNLTTKLDIETKLRELSPSQWSVDQAMDHIRKATDLAQNLAEKGINFLTKGGQYMALKTHDPLIRFVVERFLDADRRYRADVADWLYNKDTGLASLMRKLDKDHLSEAWAMINFADLHQKSIDLVKLAERGFNAAQIKLIEAHRKGMDYSLTMINKARAASGLDPVNPRVAYAAMQATGDFRSLVYDKQGGNIIGIISSDFRSRLNNLKGQMEGKGYFVEKERYFGGMPRERGSANQAFMHAIEVLGDKDPRIADFVDTLNEIRTSEINNFLNMKKHTMAKKGIFGMEGRKDVEDAHQNALDGFKTQLNYMEGAIKWGHLSEAFKDSKAVIDHPDSAHMENSKAYAERYMYNALGFNPSEVGRAIESTVATMFKKMGVGYSVGRRVMADARYLTNSLLLTLNPRFWEQNVIQPLMAMPGMKADLIARGLGAGTDLGTGYMYVAQGANTSMRIKAGLGLTPFEKAAAAYAKSRHVYGSDMVEHSNRVTKGGGYYVDQMNNFFAGSIESATRQAMFHAFAHLLHENGMKIEHGLFESAHNLTDISMNNYSAIERPQLYSTLGPAGHLAVNLQSYKHNELSRVAMFVRDSKEYGSIRPIAADMLTRFAFGGAMGMIGYDNVDALFRLATKYIGGHPMNLSNLVMRASEGANNYVNKATGGAIDQPYLLSHGIHSLVSLDMSRSLGIGSVVPDTLGTSAFPGGSKLFDAVGAAYNLTGLPSTNHNTGPTEMNFKRFAHAAAPQFAQGAIDNAWFTKGEGDNRVAVRPRDLAAQAYRDNFDYGARALGFSGLNESVQRQKTYNIERQSRDYSDLRQQPLNRIRDTLFASGRVDPQAIKDYVNLRGNVESLEGDITRYATEQRLTPREIALMKTQTTSSVAALMKAQDYLKAFSK